MTSDEEKNIGDSSLNYKIITDEPAENAPDFEKYSERLSNIIINSKPQFTVGIYGGWGTGKTTLMQMIKNELQKSEYNDNILLVWFDAWRYQENEEFSALVPLVRTIILHLEEYVLKLEIEKNPKTVVIKNLANKFKKLGESIINNSKTSLGLEYSGLKAAVETDFGKI